MNEAGLVAALLLGLVAGGHCAGMCGGIVTAFSASAAGPRRLQLTLAYHGGRALSYALAGAIVGAAGEAGLALRGGLGAQQLLFAFASLALVTTGLYLAGVGTIARRMEALGGLLWRHIEPWSRPLIPMSTPTRALLLGMVWGWLPCAMVYGALLIAIASGGAALGAATMVAFALGTLPSLLGIGVLAQVARRYVSQRRLRTAAGGAIAAVGVFGLVQLGLHAASLDDYCLLAFTR